MNYQIENLEKRLFIGIPIRTSHENGRFQKDVPPLWEKFYRENLMDKIPNKVNEDLVAVYTDYEGESTKSFTYILGFEVSSLSSIPEGMVSLEIEASPYVVFTVQGAFPLSMMQTWQKFLNSDLKRSYSTDLEIYKPNFKLHFTPEIKIYISLEKSPN